MCMEDIRLGRETKTTTKVVTLSGVNEVPLCETSEDRIALNIWAPVPGTQFVGPDSIESIATQGVPLTTGLPILSATLETWGNDVRKGWRAAASAGNALVVIQETILTKK